MAREMKDSGIEWIGEIGFDFYMMKLKYVSIILDQFRKPVTADQRNQEGEKLYDYYGASGVIDKINDYTIDDHVMLIGEDGANLKMRNLPLMYEVNGKAWVNNHAHILKPKQNIDFYYLYYVLEALDINPYITGSAQPKLNQENLKNIWIPVPDASIQKEIVCYIKDACMEIDNVLEKTRTSIEEYKKLKQAVITQAVTKGIKGDREMKNSGIEWIGEIPIEWEERRIKTLFNLREEKNYSPLEEVNLISLYTDLGVVQHSELEKTTGNKASNADGYKMVYKDDIVVNIILCWMGAIGRSEYEGVTSPAYDIYIPQNEVLSKFYHYYFRTKGFSGDCYKRGRGIMAMRWRTYSDQFRDIRVVYPSMEEQREIADYLDQKCLAIDELIAKKEQYIFEIENYKKSLIYEYVTGKKEVPLEHKA